MPLLTKEQLEINRGLVRDSFVLSKQRLSGLRDFGLFIVQRMELATDQDAWAINRWLNGLPVVGKEVEAVMMWSPALYSNRYKSFCLYRTDRPREIKPYDKPKLSPRDLYIVGPESGVFKVEDGQLAWFTSGKPRPFFLRVGLMLRPK